MLRVTLGLLATVTGLDAFLAEITEIAVITDMTAGPGNIATIVDFTDDEDSLRVKTSLFEVSGAGAQAPVAFARDSNDCILNDTASGRLYVDLDGKAFSSGRGGAEPGGL